MGSFRSGLLTVTLLMGLGTSFAVAKDLNVGDVAPEVIVEGVLPTGQPVVSSVTSSPGPTQSYTLIEFFETENADSAANLFPLYEISRDTEEHVATRLVAVNPEIADVKAFLKNNAGDVRFPVHFDHRQNAMRAFGVTKVPTIFVLKNEKEVIFKHVGVITADVRAKLLNSVGY